MTKRTETTVETRSLIATLMEKYEGLEVAESGSWNDIYKLTVTKEDGSKAGIRVRNRGELNAALRGLIYIAEILPNKTSDAVNEVFDEEKLAELEESIDEMVQAHSCEIQHLLGELAMRPTVGELEKRLYNEPCWTDGHEKLITKWSQMLIDAANLRQISIPPVDTNLLMHSQDAGVVTGVLKRYLSVIQQLLMQQAENATIVPTEWPKKV